MRNRNCGTDRLGKEEMWQEEGNREGTTGRLEVQEVTSGKVRAATMKVAARKAEGRGCQLKAARVVIALTPTPSPTTVLAQSTKEVLTRTILVVGRKPGVHTV